MKPAEIIDAIKKENPELLGKIPDKKAMRVVRAALNQISKQVNALDEGVVKVPGLGNFQAKKVVRKKDGATVRKVSFREAKPNKTAS